MTRRRFADGNQTFGYAIDFDRRVIDYYYGDMHKSVPFEEAFSEAAAVAIQIEQAIVPQPDNQLYIAVFNRYLSLSERLGEPVIGAASNAPAPPSPAGR